MLRPATRWQSRAAFTLIELSIVLAVIGLLLGGVFVGKSLMRSAQLRSVATDVVKYRAATVTFKDKYSYLPGDMPNAVSYWGAAAGGTADGYDATCAATMTPSTDARTCNGNGDGHVCEYHGGSCYETQRYWQHLANAGLIEGKFTGIGSSGAGVGAYPGTNAPVMKAQSVTLEARDSGTTAEGVNDYARPASHIYFLGRSTNASASEPFEPFMTPREAFIFDSKIDDGNPGKGFVRSYPRGATAAWLATVNACTTAGTSDVAAYDTVDADWKCAFTTMWD